MTEQKPHKWEKEIVAWAGGAKIEERWRDSLCVWRLVEEGVPPSWNRKDYEFRIYDPYRESREAKPEPGVTYVVTPIIDDYVLYSTKDFEKAKQKQKYLNDNFTQTRIARLQFIEE